MKGNSYSGVKLSWTVDAASAYAFAANYTPQYDIIFVMIKWGSKGALDYIPHEVQERVFNQLGSKTYFKLPAPGTNPRGVEISGSALRLLCNDPGTRTIIIDWIMPDVKVNVLERWVDFWEQE